MRFDMTSKTCGFDMVDAPSAGLELDHLAKFSGRLI